MKLHDAQLQSATEYAQSINALVTLQESLKPLCEQIIKLILIKNGGKATEGDIDRITDAIEAFHNNALAASAPSTISKFSKDFKAKLKDALMDTADELSRMYPKIAEKLNSIDIDKYRKGGGTSFNKKWDDFIETKELF